MQSFSGPAKQKLHLFQEKINPYIDEILQKELLQTQSTYTDFSAKSISTFHEILMRGAKRLRGSFVYYVYKMYNGTNLNHALLLSTVIEIIHAYLLVVDDFMDLSDTRRNGPTAHKILQRFSEENLDSNDDRHFGDSAAVTVGLLGAHLALSILNESDIDPQTIIRVNQNLNRKIVVTAHGQLNDILNETAKNLTEKDVFNVLKWKTGAYTYENPIHLGGILAGVEDRELEILSKYAIPGGISFQIQDDILGTFGEEGRMGKSNMDDVKEGKLTLLVYKALENASESEKEVIKGCLGNRNLTRDMHQEYQKVIMETGSLEYSREMGVKYVQEAKNALIENKQKFWNEEGFEYLLGIADYMIERNL